MHVIRENWYKMVARKCKFKKIRIHYIVLILSIFCNISSSYLVQYCMINRYSAVELEKSNEIRTIVCFQVIVQIKLKQRLFTSFLSPSFRFSWSFQGSLKRKQYRQIIKILIYKRSTETRFESIIIMFPYLLTTFYSLNNVGTSLASRLFFHTLMFLQRNKQNLCLTQQHLKLFNKYRLQYTDCQRQIMLDNLSLHFDTINFNNLLALTFNIFVMQGLHLQRFLYKTNMYNRLKWY